VAREGALLIEATRICRSFGGVVALSDVSFRVYEGQILALIGPNGAGKTTLLNIIAGSLEPRSGEVLLRGKPLVGRPPQERAKLGVARTFQQALLFDGMTVLENVMVGAHLRGRAGLLSAAMRTRASRREEEDLYLAALRCLNLVGLGSKAEESAAALPFGQQRLLAIARALACEPRVLLLDEPAAGLNRMERDDLLELLGRIRQLGVTLVLVEHDMGLVMRLAEWIVVLDQGRRIAQGTPADVRRNHAVITAYLGSEEEPAGDG
jgi:branched-chain amino acid transport system ATP-binding protein